MVTVDAVVFAVTADAIKLLLIKRGNEPFKGRWGIYAELGINALMWSSGLCRVIFLNCPLIVFLIILDDGHSA